MLAIGRIGDRRAPRPWWPGWRTRTAVAASAAFALGLLRDTTAVPALAALLHPGSVAPSVARRPTVIGEAALALAKMPTQAGKQAVEDFLAHAPAAGAGVRRAVGEALLAWWRFPRPMNVNVATRWLTSADPEIRWRAAYALTRRPTPQGTSALERLTDDPDALVRSFAVRALTAPLADSAGIVRDQALVAVIKAVGAGATR